MAIEIIRICNLCEKRIDQIINGKEVSYPVDFVCSDCIIQIERLKDLQSKENEGRGVSCVTSIILYLEIGDIKTAKYIYMQEGDKIISYPKIQNWMYKNFGCRNCFKIDCQDRICKSLREYNERDLLRNKN